MRRKIIQIADSTQLVSLPRKWCVANNLKKGDEIELIEQGRSILINSPSLKPHIKSTEVDLTGLENIVSRILGLLYKVGYDQITIRYNSPELVTLIQKCLQDDMIGYEIIEQKISQCTIKTVAINSESEFEPILRRTYLLLKSMLEGIDKAINEEDMKIIPSLRFLEKSNNKYTAFCRRVLNKYGIKTTTIPAVYYALIEEIEKIADHAKYLSDDLMNMKYINISDPIKDLFKKVVNLFVKTYELHYSFNIMKIAKLFDIRKELIEDSRTLMRSEKDNHLVILHCISIIQSLANTWTFEIQLNWKEELDSVPK